MPRTWMSLLSALFFEHHSVLRGDPVLKCRGVVYEPPADDLPHIAVVFHGDGTVLPADAVASYDAGEKLLAMVMDKLTVSQPSMR